ncbi:hypothetical protein VI817_002779 [Penicillium citrinum]|nr:hypothetical protein VI817_002779 [Penicillium citrinum]
MKIIGAAAAEGYSFEQYVALGQAVNGNTVTIASALDHCHVPGRHQQSTVPDNVVVVGAGIHNEPGQLHITPAPSVEETIDRCLKLLCDKSDTERAFVDFETNDEIGLLINNYGGLSVLELSTLADEVQIQLNSNWNIEPCRALFGAFEISLNAPGFSISLYNITAAARQSNESVATLIRQFDSTTTAASWPNTTRPSPSQQKISLKDLEAKEHEKKLASQSIKFDPTLLEAAIRVDKGCTQTGDVQEVIRSILQDIDDMGGTLGAIFGVLLSALATSLRENLSKGEISPSTPQFYAKSLNSAVASLKSHTGAREGNRTVMDILLPFQETFSETNDFLSAVQVAAKKAEATRYLKAKFGRATYVGEASSQELPDPGAWAFFEIVAGLADGLVLIPN